MTQSTELLTQILHVQIKPALGCTEPIAVALATAAASQKMPQRGGHTIYAEVSSNIYKNGKKVGIPGTKEKGNAFAAALSDICGDAAKSLEVLADVNEAAVEKAKAAIEADKVNLVLSQNGKNFYIYVKLSDDAGNVAECTIENAHDNIVSLKYNGEEFCGVSSAADTAAAPALDVPGILKDVTVRQILDYAETVPVEDIRFLLEGARMNMSIAQAGMDEFSALGVGPTTEKLVKTGVLGDDLMSRIRILTCAASDARMAGRKIPVMSSAGSGNHGLTAIIPVVLVNQQLGDDQEKLCRALAISHLITSYIKTFTGKLSPVCGCAIAAGIGAAAAIAWLYDGTYVQITGAIRNMIGTLAGMLCDGAKGGCALKLAAASTEAFLQAKLALEGCIITGGEGIVAEDVDEAIRNLGAVSSEPLKTMDQSIICLMH